MTKKIYENKIPLKEFNPIVLDRFPGKFEIHLATRKMVWEDIFYYSKEIGQEWKLPDRELLQDLSQQSKLTGSFWSGSYCKNIGDAWMVDFDHKYSITQERTKANHVIFIKEVL